MPSLDELLDTLTFNRLVGQRPFGHYDHDATCVIGPPTYEESADPEPDVFEETDSRTADETEDIVTYRRLIDPRTGELLFRTNEPADRE